MNIINIIPFGHENALSRRELGKLTGLTDRQNRELIMKARMNGAIILNLEDGAGYFRPRLPEELKLVKESLNRENGRLYAAKTICENLKSILESFSDGNYTSVSE